MLFAQEQSWQGARGDVWVGVVTRGSVARAGMVSVGLSGEKRWSATPS